MVHTPSEKSIVGIVLTFLFSCHIHGELRVVTTYPWISNLTKEIGKEKVDIYTISKGFEDPHQVIPKPSHIAKLRRADLLIIQGASLEIGFIPPLLQQSNNPKIFEGKKGFLDLSKFVNLIEKPEVLTRALGDIHPEGNPHYHLDPHNIPNLAFAIKEKLCQLDPENIDYYNENYNQFIKRWEEKLKEWDELGQYLRGMKIISYHKLFTYFSKRYGIVEEDYLEPLPGIPPTPKHLSRLIEKVREKKINCIIISPYNNPSPANLVSIKTNSRIVVLPPDIDSTFEAKELFSLFDSIFKKLMECKS